ncbi:MAG: D-alanine--D-alanine ligase [Calditrichae bacterium]|nr:D-alanine--D-alanine ligase [Calditrichia bacterium]
MKVAVLLGGTSAERDVSLVSGLAISKALAEAGHQITAVDCAFGDRVIDDWDSEINDIIRVEHSDFETKKQELDRNIMRTVQFLIENKIDVAFIALHGGYGENGQIQALLELMKIPYTGSNSLASGMGMNKHISKILFQKQGIPVANWLKLDHPEEIDNANITRMGYPLVIKPNDQGSTVGLTIVQEKNQIEPAIELAFQFSEMVLAEKYIPGKEVTISILGELALPVIEIIPEHGIYDYECKYQKGKCQYVVPAELSEKTTSDLQKYALQAYQTLGCRHYARVDFRLSPQDQPFCLEVNTLPGMTPTSLVPKAAKAIGIGFSELVDRIANMAVDKNL